MATARESGIAAAAGRDDGIDGPDALRRIDAYLCDLKDLRIKDGLHIFGRAPPQSDPCEALSRHGYFGIEDEVVTAIAEWIKES